jgi:predicted outer membrane protein
MGEKGDAARSLGDAFDEVEELQEQITDDSKLAWLSSQPISDEYEMVKKFAKQFNTTITDAKKSMNNLPKQYTISGEDIPSIVKQLRIKRRELKGQNKIDFTKSIETLVDAYANHILES